MQTDLNKFEILKVDERYSKPQGSGPQKWKIIPAEEKEVDKNKIYENALSEFVPGPGQLNEKNTPNKVQFQSSSSKQLVLIETQKILVISSDKSLLVYNNANINLLLDAKRSAEAKISNEITVPTTEPIKWVFVLEENLIVISQSQIVVYDVSGLLNDRIQPLISSNKFKPIKQAEKPYNNKYLIINNQFVIKNLASLIHDPIITPPPKFEVYGRTEKNLIIADEDLNIFLFNNSIKLAFPPIEGISIIDQVIEISNNLFLIFCLIQEEDEEDEEDESYIFTGSIRSASLVQNQIKLHELSIEAPLRKKKDPYTDLTIYSFDNDTLDGSKRQIETKIHVIGGSNLENICFLQEINGKLEQVKRVDQIEMDIQQPNLRGLALIDWELKGQNGVFSLAMNEQIYLINRFPTILTINDKLQLNQYQLIDFNKTKMEAYTKEYNKYKDQFRLIKSADTQKPFIQPNIAPQRVLQQEESKTGFLSQPKPLVPSVKEKHIIVECLPDDFSKLEMAPFYIELSLKQQKGELICGVGQIDKDEKKLKLDGLVHKVNPSGNLLVYNKQSNILFIGVCNTLLILDPQDVQNLLLNQMDYSSFTSYQQIEFDISYLFTVKDYIFVAGQETVTQFSIKDKKLIQLQKRAVKQCIKIEANQDQNTLMVVEQAKVSFYKIDDKLQLINSNIQKFDSITFFDQHVLLTQNAQIYIYDIEKQTQNTLTQSAKISDIFSFIHQISPDKIYAASLNLKNKDLKEYIIQVDLQRKSATNTVIIKCYVIKKKFSLFKSDNYHSSYEIQQADWTVQRFSLLNQSQKLKKQNDFVYINCNFLIQGYVFQVFKNDLIPIETEEEDIDFVLPSYDKVIKGITLYEGLLPREQEMNQKNGFFTFSKKGVSTTSPIPPSLLILEFNQRKFLRIHRFIVLNIDDDEIKRDKLQDDLLLKISQPKQLNEKPGFSLFQPQIIKSPFSGLVSSSGDIQSFKPPDSKVPLSDIQTGSPFGLLGPPIFGQKQDNFLKPPIDQQPKIQPSFFDTLKPTNVQPDFSLQTKQVPSMPTPVQPPSDFGLQTKQVPELTLRNTPCDIKLKQLNDIIGQSKQKKLIITSLQGLRTQTELLEGMKQVAIKQIEEYKHDLVLFDKIQVEKRNLLARLKQINSIKELVLTPSDKKDEVRRNILIEESHLRQQIEQLKEIHELYSLFIGSIQILSSPVKRKFGSPNQLEGFQITEKYFQNEISQLQSQIQKNINLSVIEECSFYQKKKSKISFSINKSQISEVKSQIQPSSFDQNDQITQSLRDQVRQSNKNSTIIQSTFKLSNNQHSKQFLGDIVFKPSTEQQPIIQPQNLKFQAPPEITERKTESSKRQMASLPSMKNLQDVYETHEPSDSEESVDVMRATVNRNPNPQIFGIMNQPQEIKTFGILPKPDVTKLQKPEVTKLIPPEKTEEKPKLFQMSQPQEEKKSEDQKQIPKPTGLSSLFSTEQKQEKPSSLPFGLFSKPESLVKEEKKQPEDTTKQIGTPEPLIKIEKKQPEDTTKQIGTQPPEQEPPKIANFLGTQPSKPEQEPPKIANFLQVQPPKIDSLPIKDPSTENVTKLTGGIFSGASQSTFPAFGQLSSEQGKGIGMFDQGQNLPAFQRQVPVVPIAGEGLFGHASTTFGQKPVVQNLGQQFSGLNFGSSSVSVPQTQGGFSLLKPSPSDNLGGGFLSSTQPINFSGISQGQDSKLFTSARK